MKRYYFRTKGKDRVGQTRYTSWKYTDTCKSKAEVKRRFGYGGQIVITEEEQKGAICWD